MRLQKRQKEALLRWISEGAQTDEINARAVAFEPPFRVSRQQVDGYRDRRAIEIKAIQQAGEHDALTAGLAVRAERVKRLQQLAVLMEQDLFGGFLWTDQVKMIGSGPFSKEVEYEEFNTAEVQQYRGILDDIAKELGHRKQVAEITGKDGGPIEINDARNQLATALSETIARRNTSGAGGSDSSTATGDGGGTPE